METLRRARFVWACLCIIVGLGTAVLMLFSTYRPELMRLYGALALGCSTWLWLPLYTRWSALGKVAAMWFLGVVPMSAFANTYKGGAAMYAIILTSAGAAALVLAWIALGLRRRPNT